MLLGSPPLTITVLWSLLSMFASISLSALRIKKAHPLRMDASTRIRPLVWIFKVTFCISISLFCSGTGDSNSFYSTHLTRSGFSVPERGIVYTNSTHNVIPLSQICVVFQKWRSFVFGTSAPSFDKNNYHITHTVSRSAIIFQAEKPHQKQIRIFERNITKFCSKNSRFLRTLTSAIWPVVTPDTRSNSRRFRTFIYKENDFTISFTRY